VGCGVLLGLVVPCFAAAANPPAQLKVGDVIPAIKATSVEGIPVAVPPAEGKFLMVHFWNPEVGDADKLAAEAVVLYRRLHAQEFNALRPRLLPSSHATAR
jgi:hypothetical protein